MAYLAQHFLAHDHIGKGVPLPEHWAQYGAWLVMADLARRHPGAFSVVEGYYPAGSTLWLLLDKPAPGSR